MFTACEPSELIEFNLKHYEKYCWMGFKIRLRVNVAHDIGMCREKEKTIMPVECESNGGSLFSDFTALFLRGCAVKSIYYVFVPFFVSFSSGCYSIKSNFLYCFKSSQQQAVILKNVP